jgi:hypothetical protein
MEFEGFGFIKIEKDKVMTVEGVGFTYRVDNGTAIYEFDLHNCVSQASLANLANTRLEFYTGTHRILATNLEVLESVEGRTKSYKIVSRDMDLVKNTEMPEHEEFDHPDYENDDFLDKFIAARKSLLDDENEDEDLDSRFGGLL